MNVCFDEVGLELARRFGGSDVITAIAYVEDERGGEISRPVSEMQNF